MAVRDIVVLNTTSSRLEAQQSSDTVRILGTSDQLLSIENSSGTAIFGLDAPSSSISIEGNLTASGNFSASVGTNSSSFGRIEATTLVGSGVNLTNTDHGLTIVSSSQQIASEISGAFDSGFEFTGTIGKAVGVWSAGGALINAQKEHVGTGLRNAALQFGGASPLGRCTEEYNGTAWSVGGAKITAANYMASAGYLTSAVSIGGYSDLDETELYDGTSWSETANLNTGRCQLGGTGIQNAAIAFGGSSPSTIGNTETFNGSTWSEVADLITARKRFGSAGTQNSALAFGGQPTCNNTEEWDGGSWATGGNLLTGATGMAGGGVGSTVNAAISVGGASPGPTTCVEEYNGTSWSVGGALINARNDFGAGGSQDSIVAFGGCVTSPWSSTCTEHYDGFLPVSASFGKVIATTISGDASRLDNTVLAGTVSSSVQIATDVSGSFNKGFEFTGTIGKSTGVYSTGGNLSVATSFGAGVGVQNAALQIAGGNPVYTCTQKYNGTAWSTGGCIAPAADIRCSNGAFGNYGSAVTFGGFPSPYERTAIWNGSSWSAGPNMGEGKIGTNGAGTMDAGLAMGGYNPGCSPSTAVSVEEWNGTAWSEGGDLISPNKFGAASGIQNAALWHRSSVTEEYNGTTWATGGSMINGRYETQAVSTSGTVNAHVLMGGYKHPANSSCTEEYDGTSWSTANAMPNVSRAASGAGSIDAALHVGGKTPSDTTATLHYDGHLPISASFGKIVATKIIGDGSTLSNTLSPGVVSSSVQLASDISGSHTSGFEFTGTIGARQGVWSSGTALPTATRAIVGVGSKNASMFFGGNAGGSNFSTNHHYNGTNWSAGGALIIATNDSATAGTEYAALSAGGQDSSIANTFEYYGETWAAGGSLIVEKSNAAGFGLQNAALVVGGRDGDSTRTMATTEQYNGSTFSEVGDLNTGLDGVAGAGTVNAAIVFGGQKGPSPFPITNCTELYNGSSWSATTGMITSRLNHGGSGLQNDAITFGGQPGPAFGATSEEWNGTAWSTGGALSTGRYSSKNFTAHAHNAIMAGGRNPGVVSCTETYTGFYTSASFGIVCAETLSGDGSKLQNTIPQNVVSSSTQLATDISGSFDSGFEFTGTIGTRTGVWSTGGTMIIGKINASGAGLENAALSFGGQSPSQQCTEHYNGSSWSSGGTPANGCYGRGADGTEYAGIVFGGYHPNVSAGSTEEYYGETFAAGGALSTGRGYLGGAGTQNAALAFGGFAPSVSDVTEEYNGTSWSSGGTMINTRGKTEGAGAQNAGLAVGGFNPTCLDATEHYDGTAWRAGGNMSKARRSLSVTGVENAALRVGGQGSGTDSREVEHYDGVAWSIGGSKNTYNHCAGAAAGTRTAGLYFGGGNPSTGPHECTEHYESYYASASFGRVDATTIAGSGLGLKNKLASGILSGSAQIANEITGSFIKGVYGITGDITTATGVWSTGVNLNTARNGGHGAGTTGGGLVSGGQTPSAVANTEEWNGTTWSESGDLITARKKLNGSTGAQDAALMGGAEPGMTCTEEYNGSTWASGGALSSNRKVSTGFGTQNAAVQTGNFQCSADWTALYDGTAWSRGARPAFHAKDGGDGTDHFAGAGTQNAGLVFAGRVAKTNTEHFDGTSWSKGGSLSTGKSYANGSGVENAALAFGGSALSPSNNVLSEEYDGVAWSSGGSMITAAGNMNTFGTLESTLASHRTVDTQEYSSYHLKTGGTCIEHIRTTSTFIDGLTRVNTNFFPSGSDAFCGSAAKECYGTMLSGSGVPNNTLKRNKQNNKLEVKRSFQMPVFYTDPVTGSAGELWYNAVDNALKFTFDYNAWSAGGALLIDRMGASHAGSQNAALAIGGKNTAANANTGSVEEYNGSTWSIGGAIPIAMVNKVAHGTQNAALAGTGNTEYYAYNGTSWSEVADNNASRDGSGGAGSQNAALLFGGYAGNPTKTEAYNGMSWTVKAELIAGRGYGASGGVVNAAILAGGLQPGAAVSCTEHFDGSTWSAGGAINHARYLLGGSGNQYAMVIFGDDGDQNCTEEYNGTTWNEVTGIITARKCFGSHSSGNQSNALATGGRTASPNTSVSCTEEYSATYVKTVCLDS